MSISQNNQSKKYSKINLKQKKSKAAKYSKTKITKGNNTKLSDRQYYNIKSEIESTNGVNNEIVEIMQRGTLIDRINATSLICLKNPTNDNIKKLLSFTENQRYDTIYYTIRNICNLLLNIDVHQLDGYIHGRIIKTLEINSKNKFIGNKILKLVEKLLDNEIFNEDMISILISSLNVYNSTFINTNFYRFPEEIVDNLEDSFYKNDNFRCQHNILKFLINKKHIKLLNFMNQIIVDKDYKINEQDLIYEKIIIVITNNLNGKITINPQLLTYILNYSGNRHTIFYSSLKLLRYTNKIQFKEFILKNYNRFISKQNNSEVIFIQELEAYLNEFNDTELVRILLDHAFFFSPSFITSILLLCYKYKIFSYSLYLYKYHYNTIVRNITFNIINKNDIQIFDPFDSLACALYE